jgi:hypothetical protein
MALQYSPRIVTDNLVMCLDASQNKSFPSTDLPVKSGLLVWLDASDDSTFSYSSGTEVSQWRDKSGNNLHANQSTVANQPSRVNTLNGRKSVNFTSANGDSLRISNGVVFSKYFTAVVLIKPATQSTAYAVILDQDHSTTGYQGWVIQRNGSTSYWQTWVANSSATNWTNANQIAYTDYTPQIVTLRKSSSTLTLYSTGTSSGDVSINDYALSQAGLYGLNIGYWKAGTDSYSDPRRYNGEICEILVYNRDLTLSELKRVHTYLGLKWGISNTDRNWHDLVSTNDSPLGNGTVANMPRFDYYNGGSLAFDGINDYVNINSGAVINGFNPDGSGAGRSRVTVNLWFKPSSVNTANTNKMIFSDNCSPEFSLHQYNNLVYAYSYAGISATIEADKWYNACWVSDAGSPSSATTTYVTFYLNGDLVGSTSTGTGNGLNDNEFNLGRDACTAGTYFSGSIGLVQLYSRDLTAAEVKQLYQAHRSRYVQTLVQGGLTLNVDAGNPYSYAGAGFDWYDVSGNSYICTLINGPTYSNGAIVFDGTNDFVDLTYPYSVSIAASGNAARSMFVWIKTTYTSNQAFISTGTAANSQSFNLVKYGSYIGVMGYNNDYYPSTGNAGILITDGVWHYIGVTFDGTNLRMYVDGILDNTSGTLTYSTTGQNNFIGKSSHTGNENYTNGSMGMVHVYNRALSGAEVLQNYNATKGRFGR